MSTCLFDHRRSRFQKIFFGQRSTDAESIGSKIFSRYVVTPIALRLNRALIDICPLEGVLGTDVPDSILVDHLVRLYEKVAGNSSPLKISPALILTNQIKRWHLPQAYKGLASELIERYKDCILFPIHGDIHKGNIIVVQGELGLIDFEHFCFAPHEFELANLLFHNDHNCPDTEGLLLRLLDKRLIDLDVLRDMGHIYFLKELHEGGSLRHSQRQLEKALKHLSQ
ncbi:MAG: Phosphotransferase enzyme family protein [Microgenomates bacterium OLB22]|nr:MAG: Phosphotransferase enzyme family protein [Microgenomates bacterium OLB22]